jgi:hypothetical protein
MPQNVWNFWSAGFVLRVTVYLLILRSLFIEDIPDEQRGIQASGAA